MTELVEYCLVVMASTLFVTGSIAVYNSFSTFESGLQLRATFAAISGLASQALQGGRANSTLVLPASTIGCDRGSLTVTIGSGSIAQRLPANCNFALNLSAGPHSLAFLSEHHELNISVS